ncbi:prepilin-type N-terminal cleavage/methylation domain-containing protein [Pseudohongiella sp. SYSU M77423]|uniref:type II secretion system protein n=1 Tax=Pseudohongiella sp. SYSU M77423 TaxID=3042312 RepID=UPI002480BF21|nr:prepilin-type N-terminal cleavage/methylation domain-containing protein [Pseudohongiella sp. SYSU M77423]MDH7942692.1 prepilin-type N-terminal cleavage/methylation domain-containing protein [Pseudohongiella sp. SYSU M77423]
MPTEGLQIEHRMSYSRLSERPIRSRSAGFSLFELMVYILAASILFAAAFNRYQDFPGEAERANFLAIQAQLNAAINLQMMQIIASGGWDNARQLDGMNPMELMLTTPGNYVGALSGADIAQLPRRIWFFDPVRGELVYLAENSENLYLLNDGQRIATERLGFRVSNRYSGTGSWEGLVLAPVQPYEWQSVPLNVPEPQQSVIASGQ